VPGSSEAAGQIALPPDVALHARPAAEFVRTAMGFSSRIEVAANERTADAKSLMAVLALGATGGTELSLRAEGEDAPGALEALVGCVAGFA
jgi:phosphocarrier protein HPr